MTDTANIHKSTTGIGYKVKFPTFGPYNCWRPTLGGAHRAARRKWARYNRYQERKRTVVKQVEFD